MNVGSLPNLDQNSADLEYNGSVGASRNQGSLPKAHSNAPTISSVEDELLDKSCFTVAQESLAMNAPK